MLTKFPYFLKETSAMLVVHRQQYVGVVCCLPLSRYQFIFSDKLIFVEICLNKFATSLFFLSTWVNTVHMTQFNDVPKICEEISGKMGLV